MSRGRRDALLLFAGLWLVYGATVNNLNLQKYLLQQAVVESLVERGTYEVGGSRINLLKTVKDTFLHEGRILPAKQPGQFTIGALAYWTCSRFGITYVADYFLTAALVTWLTASLLSALGGAFLYLIVTDAWGFGRAAGIGTTLGYGLATNLLPYSGIPHHDVIAASYLIMALYLIERSPGAGGGRALVAPLIAGVLLGATLFTSMLPGVVVLVLLARVVLARNLKRAAAVLAGLGVGLLPLLAYNAHYFGNPFLQANAAGGFTDTFFRPDPVSFLHHLNVYFGAGGLSILKYMPILVLGAAGTFLLGPRLIGQKRMLWAAIALHLAYILNIQTIGGCSTGRGT